MPPIVFQDFPTGRRTPGHHVEFNTRIAGRGLVASTTKVLFIGQRLSTGSVAELTLVQVTSPADAQAYFGRGSQLARMLVAAFAENRQLNAWAIALDDDGAGVAATQTVTFSGTASGDVLVKLWIAGELVELLARDGDAAADVAGDIDDLLTTTTAPDLPMTGAAVAAVLTMTARNKGTVGNAIDVHIEFDGDGLSAVVAAGATGATDPDIQDALDVAFPDDFDFIVSAFGDATALGSLETHLDNLVDPVESRGGLGVGANSDTYSAATTLAANFSTSGFMNVAALPGSPTWAPELAAMYAAVLASQDDPAMPYNHLPLVGALVPWDAADRLTAAEVEAALHAGVSPLVLGAGTKIRIVRAITTYVENEAGEEDDALMDVTTSRTLFYARAQLLAMLNLNYPRAKNTAARRAAIRQDIIALLYAMQAAEILEDIDEHAEQVTVETNPSVDTRIDIFIPTDVVPGLHIAAALLQLTR